MKSDNITVTQARMKQAFDKSLGKVLEKNTQKIVKNEIENLKIRTGIVTKFYPYLDKAEVKLDNTDKRVLCKILHRFGGELTEYYTPPGEEVYDESRKEKSIIPRAELHCLISNIHDEDSNEYLLLGFYSNEDLVGVNPANQGNIKIVTRGGTNQFWIKFGYDGLDLRLPSESTSNIGDVDSEMEELKYVNVDDVYSKEEIDEIIENITHGDIDISKFDVGFTYSFGLGGIDDTISIHTFIEKINGE